MRPLSDVCVTQTESLREYEHLRYIPIVLLSPLDQPLIPQSELDDLLNRKFTPHLRIVPVPPDQLTN